MSSDLVDVEPLAYPFNDPEGLDLDPAYARLRGRQPVVRVRLPYGEPTWLVTSYEEAKVVLSDRRFSRSAAYDNDEPRLRAQPWPRGGMLSMDPPEHARLRRLVAKAFTVRRVEALRPRAEQIAAELVDRMIDAGPPADFVADFALPLPLTVICELLGVPPADRQRVHEWSNAFISTTSLSSDEAMARIGKFAEYVGELVAERRASPTDDLLGALVQARDEQDRLTEDELIMLGVGITAAGHESTVTQLSNLVYMLLTHPDQLRQLRDQPDLVPSAVEELMRYIPIGVGATFARYATEDVKLGDVVVRAGEPVIVSLGSANRDPATFVDPDRMDLARTPNQHVGFGHGVHHCVGAPLARMEMRVTLQTLLQRMPGLGLAVPESNVQWKNGVLARGPQVLPIDW